ncbi:sensor histidine kinase [Agaribacterium sp. ZY112]|uniref:sensor histidine kinase n=1 Tax=Agaribacterium sp. ZY112 TaxID=3233574 RepID=UPI003526B48D
MLQFILSSYHMHRVLNLRSLAIAVQVALLALALGLDDYPIEKAQVLIVLTLELVFHIFSLTYYKKRLHAKNWELSLQLLADLGFLSLLLLFTGGATNAFVSLLLLPVAIAAVSVNARWLALISIAAVSSYSLLLFALPSPHMHHGSMQEHYIGMWLNFLFSCAVISLLVGKLAHEVNKRNNSIARFREEQLKQEQVLSLGLASAQVTHQLATPLASIQLLIDELEEEYPNEVLLSQIQEQMQRCSNNLEHFRQLAVDSKEQSIKHISVKELLCELEEHLQLNFSDANISLTLAGDSSPLIASESGLVSAIINLLQNALRASLRNNNSKVDISLISKKESSDKNANPIKHLIIQVQDYGTGFTDERLSELGEAPVESKDGLGLAVFLSHTTIERLGGKLILKNNKDHHGLAEIHIPFI